MTSLAIVIVNWNGGHLLRRCLESIRAARCPLRLDVIIVDNHSHDGSREMALTTFPEFRTVDSGSNLGFGRANNLAASLTDSSLVLFLNPDTELQTDTLEQALSCLSQHPDAAALGCRMIHHDGRVHELGLQWPVTPWTVLLELLLVTSRSFDFLRHWLPTVDPERTGPVEKLYGGFLLVRRDVLDAAGWFDERYFMYAEDVDLCRTIRSFGWKLYYCSEAVIVHVAGGVTAAAPGAFGVLMKQDSLNKFIEKHHGRHASCIHRLAVFTGGLVRLTILLPACCVGLLQGTWASRWRPSCRKQLLLILWAIGLRKAQVPVFELRRDSTAPDAVSLPR